MRPRLRQTMSMEPPEPKPITLVEDYNANITAMSEEVSRYRTLLADIYQHLGRCQYTEGFMQAEADEFRDRIRRELERE